VRIASLFLLSSSLALRADPLHYTVSGSKLVFRREQRVIQNFFIHTRSNPMAP